VRPGQPELVVGAVDDAGADRAYFDVVSDEKVREEIRTHQEILRKRRMLCRSLALSCGWNSRERE
jgi:hypothetical protein